MPPTQQCMKVFPYSNGAHPTFRQSDPDDLVINLAASHRGSTE